jgi:hypothetical protein
MNIFSSLVPSNSDAHGFSEMHASNVHVRTSPTRLCPIHDRFRIVCIVEKHDAYTRLAAPLLNRFEKQVLERNHLLNADHVFLVKRLRAFVQCLGADLVKADARDGSRLGHFFEIRISRGYRCRIPMTT